MRALHQRRQQVVRQFFTVGGEGGKVLRASFTSGLQPAARCFHAAAR
ncbi:MAG: hypothetical protein ACK55Z_33410 [bacterium]